MRLVYRKPGTTSAWHVDNEIPKSGGSRPENSAGEINGRRPGRISRPVISRLRFNPPSPRPALSLLGGHNIRERNLLDPRTRAHMHTRMHAGARARLFLARLLTQGNNAVGAGAVVFVFRGKKYSEYRRASC